MSGNHLSSESAALEGIVAEHGDIIEALDGRQEVCAHGDIIEALEGREKVCAHSDIIGALEGRQEVCAHSDIIGALREGRRYVHHFCGPLPSSPYVQQPWQYEFHIRQQGHHYDNRVSLWQQGMF